jgi:uncharacterized alpha-E superfamily protein
MWERVNGFYHMVKDAVQLDLASDPHNFFAEVKLASHLFAGVMDATMTHGEGWNFGHIGRLLERADKTARILDVKYYILLPSVQYVGMALDELQWISLLKSASAYEMYRKRSNQHRITPVGVAEFLILNREFPRSIQFCLQQADCSLRQITGTPTGTWHNSVERALGRLRSELDYLTIKDIVDQGLHEFLDHLQLEMNEVGEKMFETFFALSLAK